LPDWNESGISWKLTQTNSYGSIALLRFVTVVRFCGCSAGLG